MITAVLGVLLVPAVGATISAVATLGALYAPGPDRPVPAALPSTHDPTRPTAVVVVGNRGAVVSDVLAPYEILAATGRFNVYTAAPERQPVPLTGGLDLVPDLTFDDLAARTGSGGPDLVVIPALPDVGERSTAPVTEWLRAQDAAGVLLLAVCNGSGVLASAGLLDGRPAAAHWLRIGSFEEAYPQVDWVRGQRYIDDGDVVSTAGILSSIDGTLHVVGRLAGASVAADAADTVGWRHYGEDVPVATGVGVPGPAAIVNAGFRWNPPTIGVMLTDGVGEIELASVFDVHGQSLAHRTLAVTVDGGPVRSRHGLTFLPRADLADAAPGLDRLLVPGVSAAAAHAVEPPAGGPAPEYLHDPPGFAFDTSLRDLAATVDVATARWTAKVLELPTTGLVLDGPAWPWAPTAFAVVLVLVDAAAVAWVTRRLRRRRDRARRTPFHRPPTGRTTPAPAAGRRRAGDAGERSTQDTAGPPASPPPTRPCDAQPAP
ncbi:DJ-1/PfpI family protein [Geodermatophilus sp. YIM 151500]|uniref:DJ-1/PfpI family protein n=1 Tax=Geodermatophilus sp. YIM 151500 TaxID=2984531 RepID=UPI0021E47C99|nr:DJ-1/PfpI family protein [Geodermatophilus sp. YIM 151500]MCV2489791.1 DJ-1/PfpI family protein [Geodermatophilus sp. YIM 151500]